MFGLMKNTSCSQSGQADWYRLHYCGTCKSLGQIYGQRSRLFLNYDIVFLSEVLSLLQEEDVRKWDTSLQSSNCFNLPKTEALPKSLQFAADINTVLVELKVRDNMVDDSRQLWTWVKRLLNKPFSRLEGRMDLWGIDNQVLFDFQIEDLKREQVKRAKNSVFELLDFHAEPSANITAYLFAKGAEAVEKPAWTETIHQIGFLFGELIYGLDAWRDFEKDEESESFNPLLNFGEISVDTTKNKAVDWLWERASRLDTLIQTFEIDTEVKKVLQARLQMNLAAALGESAPVCSPQTGIEKSTVPRAMRAFFKTSRQVSAWLNPAKPYKFALSYSLILLVFFQQKLLAAARLMEEPSSWGLDEILLYLGLIGTPLALIYAGKKVKGNRDRIQRKIDRQQKRLLKKARRAEKRLKDGKKLKWWEWGLIGFGVLLAIAIAGDATDGGEFCGGCCEPNCGDCGDCGGCEPDCSC